MLPPTPMAMVRKSWVKPTGSVAIQPKAVLIPFLPVTVSHLRVPESLSVGSVIRPPNNLPMSPPRVSRVLSSDSQKP